MRRPGKRSSILLTFATLLLVVPWFLYMRPTFLGGPASYIVVSGRSMEPTLYEGDLVVAMSRDNYRVGDIVAFRASGGVVIHRIIGGDAAQGFDVQGDNNKNSDAWLPKPENIMGAAAVKLSHVGTVFSVLQQPVLLGTVAGTVAMMAVAGGAAVIVRRRRRGGPPPSRRRGAQAALVAVPQLAVVAAAPVKRPTAKGTLIAASAAGAVSVLALGTAFYAWITPGEAPRSVEQGRYQHEGTFTYSAVVDPSTLYGTERLEGAALGLDDATRRKTPIYSQLLRTLDLSLQYRLTSDMPAAVSGTAKAAVRIKAGDNGWVKHLDVIPATSFNGSSTELRIPVDVRGLLGFLQTVEEETGFRPPHYEFTVLPVVQVAGKVGENDIDQEYSPPFTFRYTRTEVIVDAQTKQAQSRSVTEQVMEPRQFGLFGLSLSLETIRLATLGDAGVALLLTIVLCVLAYRRQDRSEAAKIRSRYRSILVDVAEVAWYKEAAGLAVADFQDLARLAQRDGGLVFHYQPDPGAHIYFVPDSGLTYEYRIIDETGAA